VEPVLTGCDLLDADTVISLDNHNLATRHETVVHQDFNGFINGTV